jgi:hypothetical protein
MTGLRAGLWAVVLVALSLAPARVVAGPGQDLRGVYLARGINADGAEYRRLVYITPHGDSVLVSWVAVHKQDKDVTLEPTSVGIGIVRDGMLAVSYLSPDTTGVMMYRIEEGGDRLMGRWVIAGKDGRVRDEILTKLTEPDVEPTANEPSADLPAQTLPAHVAQLLSL